MTQINSTVALAVVQAVADAPFAPGEGTATLSLFAGAMPDEISTAVDAETNTHIATFEYVDAMFGDAALVEGMNAVEALAISLPEVLADAAGTISFFRIYDTEGVPIMQSDSVSEDPESNADVVINQLDVTAGAEVRIERLVVGMAF